jgi:hypothetical protein
MRQFLELFNLASGKILSTEHDGAASRAQIIVRATLASVVFAALYGLAVGSTDVGLAVGDLYKLPMVLLLSTVCAVPVALLTRKLLGGPNRASDLLLGAAAGNFTASLVLVSLSPIVALYYHTSGHLGGVLALCTGGLAAALGFWNAARAVWSRRPDGLALSRLPGLVVPLGVMIFAQMASLAQFIHVASPILPEVTVFDGGVDRILGD